MESLADIWAGILDILRAELTPVAMTTWFSDCTPVDITDNKFIIYTPKEFKRGIILSRFAKSICAALSDLFSCEFELVVLAEDELKKYELNKAAEDELPEIAGYTFDQFIVGASNKFAHAAALAVAENPGSAYNPLLIYGNSGLGKTHLLLSIGQAIHQNDPSAKIAYVKGDEFTNQLVLSIQQHKQEEFRQKYRHVDLLLMDDIQFIAGRQSTQEEFFHTFNSLYEAGKQIVITSDRPPMEMEKLEDRLRTRFEGGMIADVQPPDLETRMAIIRNKALKLGMVLSDEVVTFIAENITANIRQIEGVVKRLTAYKELLDDSITIDLVKTVIKDVARTGIYIPTPEIIIDETARYYSVIPEELRGPSREKNIALARQVSMYLIRILINLSLEDIGKEFNRNHSTVLSSIRKIEELLKTDPAMASTIRDISSNINSKN